jgi:hypothetical protein
VILWIELLTEAAEWVVLGTFNIRLWLPVFGGRVPDWVNRVFFETRWIYPGLVVWDDFIHPVLTEGHLSWGNYFGLGLGAAIYWYMRRQKDDDDRWKRRAREAGKRIVMTLQGGLAAVPAR